MEVSVIVCTRNRADSLGRCLASIAADRSATPAEVIVVDNGSTDHTGEVLERLAASARRVKVVHESRPGHSRARNAGVVAAQGNYLLFTDDDVTVEDGWIDALHGAFASGVVAVGGRILPALTGDIPEWLEGYVSPATLIDFGGNGRDMTADQLPFGANMAFAGSVLRSRLPDPFHPRLGHTGSATLGWDETHLLLTLLFEGRVVYEPTARVTHWAEADRWSYSKMRRAYYQLGVGEGRHRRLDGEPLPPPWRRSIAAAKAWRHVFLARRHGKERTPASAQVEFWVSHLAGLHTELAVGRSAILSDWITRLI